MAQSYEGDRPDLPNSLKECKIDYSAMEKEEKAKVDLGTSPSTLRLDRVLDVVVECK
jgi:hypothetical protein